MPQLAVRVVEAAVAQRKVVRCPFLRQRVVALQAAEGEVESDERLDWRPIGLFLQHVLSLFDVGSKRVPGKRCGWRRAGNRCTCARLIMHSLDSAAELFALLAAAMAVVTDARAASGCACKLDDKNENKFGSLDRSVSVRALAASSYCSAAAAAPDNLSKSLHSLQTDNANAAFR